MICARTFCCKALEAEVGSGTADLGTLFTDDVVGWSPYATVSGLTSLTDLAGLRELAFSNVALSLRGLDEVGNKAFAEWLIDADHTGPLVLGDETVLDATGRHVQLAGVTVADFRDGRIRVVPDVLRRRLADRAARRRPDRARAVEFQVEDDPDPLDVEFLERQIRRQASAAMGLGEEVELAIFVRDAGRIVAGISGWTWGDCCELQSLWVEPGQGGRWLGSRLLAAAEAEAVARGCTQVVHFSWGFQARPLYERAGYELVGRVEDFPAGTDVRWYRKRLRPSAVAQSTT